MKRTVLLCILLATGIKSYGCITCNRQIQAALFDSTFYPNLLVMASPFLVLVLIIAVLVRLTTRRHRTGLAASPDLKATTSMPLTAAASVLGIGLGGFIDGIVLHQLLQWHQMLSAKIPPDTLVAKSVNMFWDGIFHCFTLLTTIIGCSLLWQLLHRQLINRSGYLFTGGLLIGWALFNLVEGIIDHHILVLHHVREQTTNQNAWDYGFLGFSVLLLLVGCALLQKGRRAYRIL